MSKANGGGFFAAIPAGWANTGDGKACFLLFLVGFAIKAGLSPFHFWLPVAHGAAPCQVAAFSSGLGVKAGIFGLFRLLLWVPDPPLWWAGCILLLGALSALLGAINSVAQKDCTRFLAFSTVENMGIAAIALSLAFAGKAVSQPTLMALGLIGGLVHVLNHCITKPMLFLGAGAVQTLAGTRDLDQLGGLAKKQPKIATAFLFGAASICGLPPLFGFVGKWAILLCAFEGFMHSDWIWATTALAAMALASGLTMLAYARAFGAAFLGWPRSLMAEKAVKIPKLTEMTLFALLAVGIALSLVPAALAYALQPVLDLFGQTNASMDSFPALLEIVPMIAMGLTTWLMVAFAVFLWWRLKKTAARRQPAWDCGYVQASSRVQYTASSFAQMANDFFSGILVHKKAMPHIGGAFPGQSRFSSESPDPMLDYGLAPVFRGAAWLSAKLRIAQGGMLPIYLLYVVIALLVLLAWTLA
jgi:hydrogenase-4 component B